MMVRFLTALIIAKLALFVMKFSKTSGTSLVGMLVLKICPDFLSKAKKYVKSDKISVTGTNGKTTTAGLISCIFENNGRKIVNNKQGANMLTGVANAFAQKLLPAFNFDNCVIESDEAYLLKLYNYMEFDYLVITNLFRDQLDRYGEIDTTALKIKRAIEKNPALKLVVNADDPLLINLGGANKSVYFGFKHIEFNTDKSNFESPKEVPLCACGREFKYDKTFFAHLGHYYCDCSFTRPNPKYNACLVLHKNYSELTVYKSTFRIPLAGVYNAYNALAAIAVGFECGFNPEQIQNALDKYEGEFGRSQTLNYKGCKALIHLIKNPTGASEVLKTVDTNTKILVAINDNYADGRDVSWLWDSAFENLAAAKEKIICSGIRAYDMALRLKYAGVGEEKLIVIEDINRALNYLVKNKEDVTILSSYTALLEIKKIMRKK
jgi:UDP-N-acetylmuramyl tripeptide synthase